MSVTWTGQPERLDRALDTLGLARSRSHAAQLIAAGNVRVAGRVSDRANTKVRSGDAIEVQAARYVSRAAQKLVDALENPNIDPSGKLALDLGASTGGFTQVLLERGARHVLAIDVGHDQMAPEIRNDARVTLVEGCNARALTPELLSRLTGVHEAPEIVVADLSFISLTHVLGPIAAVAEPRADVIVLIKPQFEVGRDHIGDGVVTDARLHQQAVERVLASAREHGFEVCEVRPTSLAGTHGNQEFLAHLRAPNPEDQREWGSDERG